MSDISQVWNKNSNSIDQQYRDNYNNIDWPSKREQENDNKNTEESDNS
ncbi:MAG: hypothetical protein ACK5N8_06770 [Alphaproteobacteria bacterium]